MFTILESIFPALVHSLPLPSGTPGLTPLSLAAADGPPSNSLSLATSGLLTFGFSLACGSLAALSPSLPFSLFSSDAFYWDFYGVVESLKFPGLGSVTPSLLEAGAS